MSDAPINRPPPREFTGRAMCILGNRSASRAINSGAWGPYDPFYSNAVARPVILGKHRANCEKIGPLWSNETDV